MNPRLLSTICLFFVIFAISGCGLGDSERPRESKPRAQISVSFPYNLERSEERGGHTLERHVARTDDQLRERLAQEGNISAASTWIDRKTAEDVVGEALAVERSRVDAWRQRGYPRANLALHYNAGRVIGRSLRRGDTQTVDCTSAVVVLRADGPDDFYVLTTYPEARE